MNITASNINYPIPNAIISNIKILGNQTVLPYRSISITGVFLFLTIFVQIITGLVVAFSFISEPMVVPISRNEEDLGCLYVDDFFWLHERGVDLVFILMYVHLLRKLYLKAYQHHQSTTWKSGSIMFLLIHAIIFFGISLCCTHLSDITLTIAANIVRTLCLKHGKMYWIIFTNQTLNSDTVIRLAYIHFILPFFLIYLGFLHSMDMHYGWRDTLFMSNQKLTFFWLYDVAKNEFLSYTNALLIFLCTTTALFIPNESLSYEFFMWGDLGIINDVRFLSVAPHWYFRPYMGWLILCPHHYIGVFGLLYFMFLIFFQPDLKMSSNDLYLFNRYDDSITTNGSILHDFFFTLLVFCILYTGSFLPYGRFYILVGGNSALTMSYIYIFVYLSLPAVKGISLNSLLDVYDSEKTIKQNLI